VVLLAGIAGGLVAALSRSGSILPPPLPRDAAKGAIPVRVLRGPHHEQLVVARVRIDGKGPFPFLVDTGAAISVVNAPLAAALHLAVIKASSGKVQGAGCTSSSGEDHVRDWRVGRLRLPPTDVTTVELSRGTGDSEIQGLLGSNLWQRFGSLSIDYSAGRASVGTLPPGRAIPVRVARADGEVLVVASVVVHGQGPYPFVVDTGASEAVVSTALEEAFHFPEIRRSVTVDAVGCHSKASGVRVSDWRLGGVALPEVHALALTRPFGAGAPRRIGIIGSDVLSRFGVVTFDYAGQRLVLGSGSKSTVAALGHPGSPRHSIGLATASRSEARDAAAERARPTERTG